LGITELIRFALAVVTFRRSRVWLILQSLQQVNYQGAISGKLQMRPVARRKPRYTGLQYAGRKAFFGSKAQTIPLWRTA
jgi:hypothetical protein